MSTMVSQITSLTIVYLTVYSAAYEKSSAALAFVRGIHRWPVNSPHKGPVTRKMVPFNDVIMSMVYVSGGCRVSNRPINRKSCDPPCHQDNAFCEEINECGCYLGFEPIFDQSRLVACVRKIAGKNSTKNGDMDAENLALYYPSKYSTWWISGNTLHF